MRRRVVRFEMSPRFSASKAPFGDQRELSAKLTERIRTLLFRPYQRRNTAGRRIRSLRIRIGAVLSATPLLRNSSVSFADSSFYTKEPLDGANARHLKCFWAPPHPALRATFPTWGRLWDCTMPWLSLWESCRRRRLRGHARAEYCGDRWPEGMTTQEHLPRRSGA